MECELNLYYIKSICVTPTPELHWPQYFTCFLLLWS